MFSDKLKRFLGGGEQSAKQLSHDAYKGAQDLGMPFGINRNQDGRVTDNREEHFNTQSGQFHNPHTGRFEPGGPPPDYDSRTDRYRAKNGQFKKRSSDLYDEREEERRNRLWPRG